MVLGTEWATIDEVKNLIAEPYPADNEIRQAIERATTALSSAFCVVPEDTDPEDTYPDDWRVREGCAILAAQVLVASPISPGGGDEDVFQEAIGGYSYQRRSGRSAATALRIDGRVKELVGAYLCPGELGMFSLETIKYRHGPVVVD